MGNNSKNYLDEDTRLMLKVADGDEAAYAWLYKKYFPVLVDYAVSLDGHKTSPEDIAQEVFTRIWENRIKYQPTATFKTYLFGYTKNILQESKSTLYRVKTLDINQLPNLPAALHQSDALAKNENIIESLKKIIAKLPTKQKRVVELVYISGFSPKKTAETLQYSAHSVYDNLYRARKNLRKLVASTPT